MKHQRKAQAQRWLQSFHILLEEKRQETIRIKTEQMEHQCKAQA